jgi:uncharacterized OB-fold protein
LRFAALVTKPGEISGHGTVYTHSTVASAPTGFDDIAPYTVAVVDLEEGGRLLAWIGETIRKELPVPKNTLAKKTLSPSVHRFAELMAG